jgi:hypothetical protein
MDSLLFKDIINNYVISMNSVYTVYIKLRYNKDNLFMAMIIFLAKYYNNDISRIMKPSIYKNIKEAYYGGITEVYRPYEKNLFYYDVNSLYPFVALNDMPGLVCDKLIYYNHITDIEELFGFFYCKIEAPSNLYLGLLPPVRQNLGIVFPLGC